MYRSMVRSLSYIARCEGSSSMNFDLKVNSKKVMILLLAMACVAILGGILLFPLVVAKAEAAFVAGAASVLSVELI